jgi:hypothetical protein
MGYTMRAVPRQGIAFKDGVDDGFEVGHITLQ